MTEPYWSNGVSTLYHADAKALPLPDASVHCVVTSPPYWGLRDYGLMEWVDGNPECSHTFGRIGSARADGIVNDTKVVRNRNGAGPAPTECHCGAKQIASGIGLEPTLGEWVEDIVAAMREVHRVLRSDGTLWLNLGDAYAGSWGNYGSREGQQRSRISELWHRPAYENVDNGFRDKPPGAEMEGLAPKNLMGQPWRVAFALQDDGWILRSAVVWAKPNPMPESVTDRPTSSYEMIFMFSKEGRYFYDAEAVRQVHSQGTIDRFGKNPLHSSRNKLGESGMVRSNQSFHDSTPSGLVGGANLRNVWTFPTQARPEAHFATYPDALPRRCILAGTSEKGVCGDCGAPWRRMVEVNAAPHDTETNSAYEQGSNAGNLSKLRQASRARGGEYQQGGGTLGWQPTCACNSVQPVPATVLDPFVGSGTTVYVAQSLGRRGVGVDLNQDYLDMARDTVGKLTLPMQLG